MHHFYKCNFIKQEKCSFWSGCRSSYFIVCIFQKLLIRERTEEWRHYFFRVFCPLPEKLISGKCSLLESGYFTSEKITWKFTMGIEFLNKDLAEKSGTDEWKWINQTANNTRICLFLHVFIKIFHLSASCGYVVRISSRKSIHFRSILIHKCYFFSASYGIMK